MKREVQSIYPEKKICFALNHTDTTRFLYLIMLVITVLLNPTSSLAKTVKIEILMASDVRESTVRGFKEGLLAHEEREGHTFSYQIKNAKGERTKLPQLAQEIVTSNPDVAIASGGIEADALLEATAGTDIPVVFLSVSSSVERGIVASMLSSENNFTGIDTNDTLLTAKRLWYIRKILPEATTILCFHVPSIVPSVQSLAIAKENAAALGFRLKVAEVESEEDIIKATTLLTGTDIDVILLLPVAPVDKALQQIIVPKAMQENIPIFGYGNNSLSSGAFASYAGSRYANGHQAARLVHKIINNIKPRDIPIESPEKLELIINRNLVDKLGLKLSSRVWRMADQIIDTSF